jgi:acylphosphatase
MSVRRVVHVRICGVVQGVGFRAWTQHQAELHGLEGWARNRRDGSVEAVFAGPSEIVDAILKACRQGPRGSRVEDVDAQETDEGALTERPEASGFVLLGTA